MSIPIDIYTLINRFFTLNPVFNAVLLVFLGRVFTDRNDRYLKN